MEQEYTKLNEIHTYIDNIKKYAYKDIYNLENKVLSKNPYTSDFIKNYLKNVVKKNPSKIFKLKQVSVFYIKNIVKYIIYLISFFLFKLTAKKNNINFNNNLILIDTFFLVDKIIREKQFNESYFIGLSNILDKHGIEYLFLPRLNGVENNPFKIIDLMNVLNKDKNTFLFEYTLLSFLDFIKILKFIFIYPFTTMNLLQKGDNRVDTLFNFEIIKSLSTTSFSAYIRYLVGLKLIKKISPKSKIISWQEFQNTEKTFYKAINESQTNVLIYGCQFFIQYQNYISIHITDVDKELGITPSITLLNGKYNYNISKKQKYASGVSLRYKQIFDFKGIEDPKYCIVLLTYDVKESIRMLSFLNCMTHVKIKMHPTTSYDQFSNYINNKWEVIETGLYELFKHAKIVIVGSMSGTGLEAVSVGLSVIIIASKDSITSNPLMEYGKGKIWDIAFSENDVKFLYNKLIKYRNNNSSEIEDIASWYKENFFIEPTEKRIIQTFDLDLKET